MAHFQHDCETKDLPDTGYGEKFYELLSDLELPGNNKGSPNHIRVFGRQGTDNKQDSHDSG